MKNEELILAMSRIVDRDESLRDWQLFERSATRDASLWTELGRTLQDDCRLRISLARELERIPDAERAHGVLSLQRPRPELARRNWTIGLLGASLLALIWLIFGPALGPQQNEELSAAVLLSKYLAQGKTAGTVIKELPRITLEVIEDADSQEIEVVFVRRILEKGRVKQLWQVLRDEHGRAEPIPLTEPDLRRIRAATSL